MMNKSLLNLAVLCGTASFGQLPNAIEIAPKMYPGWNLGNTLEGGGTDNVYTNNGGLGAEKAWQYSTRTVWTESWRVQLLPLGVGLLPASVTRFLQLLNPQASTIR